MGLNFRKSINLGKGFKLNIGKKSVGISGGRKTATFSIPGTGLSYTMNLGKKKSSKKKGSNTKNDDNTNGGNSNGLTVVLLIIIVILLLVIIGAGFAWFTGLI